MEDLEQPIGSPVLSDHDADITQRDPLDPEIDEENSEPADGVVDTHADVDTYEDLPNTMDENEDALEQGATGAAADAADNSDAESELEELDEQEFADFDPSALNIPDKPVAVDADNVGLLGVHKRKRTEEEEAARKKKKKEGRREKVRKPKRVRAGQEDDDEPDFEGGPELDGKRRRQGKSAGGGERKAPRARVEPDDDDLTPEERAYHIPCQQYMHIC